MSISAQPFNISRVESIKPMFDALGLSGPDPIIVRSGDIHESEKFDLKPGEKSLKSRILTLIDNNRPNIALDIMQNAASNDRDAFDAIFFDVKEALLDNGYEQDAEDLDKIAEQPEFKPQDIDYDLVASRLALG